MGRTTGIAWTHATFSPWRGCTKDDEDCRNCYAETQSKRNLKVLGQWGPNGARVVAAEAYWRQPIKWNAEAEMRRERLRVFPSLCDPFEGEDTMPAEARQPIAAARKRFFDLIDATPWIDWLLLTKRPQHIRAQWPRAAWAGAYRRNVWLLTSAGNQRTLEKRLPALLQCRDLSPVLGLSLEPLIGPVDLRQAEMWWTADTGALPEGERPIPGIDWVIVGGESGGQARPFNVEWARGIRDQCAAARVPFFFKQLGSRPYDPAWHGDGTPEGSRMEPRAPKGDDPEEWPHELRIQEFPRCTDEAA